MSNLVKYTPQRMLGATPTTPAAAAVDMGAQIATLQTLVNLFAGNTAPTPGQIQASQAAAAAIQADMAVIAGSAPSTGATGATGYSGGVVAAVGVASFLGGIIADEVVRSARK